MAREKPDKAKSLESSIWDTAWSASVSHENDDRISVYGKPAQKTIGEVGRVITASLKRSFCMSCL